MIPVQVADENMVDLPQADPVFAKLHLCTFSAINKKTVFVMIDNGGRKPTPGRRRSSRSSKKKNFEHFLSFVRIALFVRAKLVSEVESLTLTVYTYKVIVPQRKTDHLCYNHFAHHFSKFTSHARQKTKIPSQARLQR